MAGVVLRAFGAGLAGASAQPFALAMAARVRRAHWHTYLVGPGRSERRLKWLPPIPVNAGDPDALPVTVRPVEPATTANEA